jgi:hypothetical protein
MFCIFINSVSIALFPPPLPNVTKLCSVWILCGGIWYRFWLHSNIPLSVLALISVHATANTNVPGLLTTLLHHIHCRGLGGRIHTTGKILPIKVTENRLFYFSRVTSSSTTAHTFTYFLLPSYIWINGVEYIFLCSFNHAFHKIQCQPTIAWIQSRSWFA